MILIFQHNNLTVLEWTAVRRELRAALADVEVPGLPEEFSSKIQLQVIRLRMFKVAMRLTEFYDPSTVPESQATTISGKKVKVRYNHDLSEAARNAVKSAAGDPDNLPAGSLSAELAPVLVGPIALLTMPAVSPAHLAAALKVLAPSPPTFSAPTRKKRPGYWEPTVQSGLQKLLLVGGRVENRVFDLDGVKWVGGIEGLDSLRAQLVAMLQSAGMGLTSALEGAGKSIWLTMESRRTMLEEEAKGPDGDKDS